MKFADICCALLVALIWGLAFLATKFALQELSPLQATALRFVIAALPCLVVRRPNVSWWLLIGLALTLYVAQFLSQFYAIARGLPLGLAGVIVQSQALFTVGFAIFAFGEYPTRAQAIGIGVAAVGLLMIAGTVGHELSAATFAIAMISPITFALGNILLRGVRDVDMFSLFCWGSVIPPVPLLLLAFAEDGPAETMHAFVHMSPVVLASVLMLGFGSTTLAYWLWGRLLRDYTPAQVVPFALLVPFVSAVASAVVFGERFGALRLAGMLTVIAGLAIMVFLSRRPPPLEAV